MIYGEIAANAQTAFPNGTSTAIGSMNTTIRLDGVTKVGNDLAAPVTGLYEIVGRIYLTQLANAGPIYTGFGKNGGGLDLAGLPSTLAGKETSTTDVAYPIVGSSRLAAGDTVGLRVSSYAGAGVAFADTNGPNHTRFSIRYLGPAR